MSTRVGIIGGGVMGLGIAQLALSRGHAVRIIEDGEASSQPANIEEKIQSRLNAIFERLIKKGRLDNDTRDNYLKNLSVHFSLNKLSSCELVIEAVPEVFSLKQSLLAQAEKIISPNTILASNTSTLSITALSGCLSDPGRLIGIHFFNPPAVMKLAEIVKGLHTRKAIIEKATQQMEDWGKSIIHSSSSPGFVVNRVARPYYTESLSILDEGFKSPQVIDDLLVGSNIFPMGVFALMDLIGVDTNYRNTEEMFKAFYFDRRYKPSLTQLEFVHAKRWGKKTGIGFYSYDEHGVKQSSEEIKTSSSYPIKKEKLSIEIQGEDATWRAMGKAFKQVGIKVKSKKKLSRTQSISTLTISNSGKKKSPKDIQVTLTPSMGKLNATQKKNINKKHRNCIQCDLIVDFNSTTCIGLTDPGDETLKAFLSALFSCLNKKIHFIPDIPGMAVQRILTVLINEALQAVGENVTTDEDVDKGMTLGMNFKIGPIKLAQQLGYNYVFSVLDNLFQVTRDEKYRPSLELLRRKEDEINNGKFR